MTTTLRAELKALAKAESESRWPDNPNYDATRICLGRTAFIEGALWASEQTTPPTPAAVTTVRRLRALQGAAPVIIADASGNAAQWHPDAKAVDDVERRGAWLTMTGNQVGAERIPLPATVLTPTTPTPATVIERAAEVVGSVRVTRGSNSDIAQALADAGLLAEGTAGGASNG